MRPWMLVPMLCAATTGAAAQTLELLAPMSTARAVHQAIALPGRGQVLLVGGCAGDSCSPVLGSAELFDPATRRFAPLGAMAVPRVSHGVAPLADGRILVVGGWDGRADQAATELFDPATRNFSTTGSLRTARQHPVVEALPDGRVLVAGGGPQSGAPLASSELYDPAQGRFEPGPAMTEPRTHHAAAALPDGRVLITGGLRARHQATASAELFDPQTGRFTAVGAMLGARYKHAAVALRDGRVLVVGGSSGRDEHGLLATTEIFDPATARFTVGPPLGAGRFKIADAVTVLPDGMVIVAGGAPAIESWRPGEAAFQPLAGASLAESWHFGTGVALPSGDLFIAGGYDARIRSTARTWLLRPAATRAAALQNQ